MQVHGAATKGPFTPPGPPVCHCCFFPACKRSAEENCLRELGREGSQICPGECRQFCLLCKCGWSQISRERRLRNFFWNVWEADIRVVSVPTSQHDCQPEAGQWHDNGIFTSQLSLYMLLSFQPNPCSRKLDRSFGSWHVSAQPRMCNLILGCLSALCRSSGSALGTPPVFVLQAFSHERSCCLSTPNHLLPKGSEPDLGRQGQYAVHP